MITGNEPINPVIWDSRHNPEFEVSMFLDTLQNRDKTLLKMNF